MVLDAAWFNIHHYKVRIKDKVEQSRESPPLHYGVVAIEKGAFRSSSTTVANFTDLYNVSREIVNLVIFGLEDY